MNGNIKGWHAVVVKTCKPLDTLASVEFRMHGTSMPPHQKTRKGFITWPESVDTYPSDLLLGDIPSRCLQCGGTATLKDRPFVGGPGAVDVFSPLLGMRIKAKIRYDERMRLRQS